MQDLTLNLPQDVRVLAFEEHYHVFPLIRHRTHTAADETLNVLRSFVALWKSPERVLSFSLSVVTDDVELRLSLLGGCIALADWLQRFTFPPQTTEERTTWVSDVSDYLNSSPPVHDAPALGRVIKADGIFFLPRVTIPREWIAQVNQTGGLELNLEAIKENDPDIADLAGGSTIKGVFCGFISRSTCTCCGDEYRSCQCSKYADSGVAERVEAFDFVSFHWSDRPA